MTSTLNYAWYPHTRNRNVASFRLRCLLPMQELERRGYRQELYDGARRDGYDVVIFSKAYDEAALAEAAYLRQRGITLVLDICDNHFYNPNGLEYWTRTGRRLERMIAMADHVVAASRVLAGVVREQTGRESGITVIGDAVEDFASYPPVPGFGSLPVRVKLHYYRALIGKYTERQNRFPLVWFGNHGSPYADEGGMSDLLRLRELLHGINARHPVLLTVISNNRRKFKSLFRDWQIPLAYIGWDTVTFRPLLKLHKVSVIPITRNPFTESKTNNRLALSINECVAVVADSIDSYRELERVCFLDDWENGLCRYIEDPDLRHRHVDEGRKLLARDWSIKKIADDWERLLGAV